MNKLTSYILIVLCYNWISCNSQKIQSKKDISSQNGVLIYYMHEPYFFLTTDTSIKAISKANLIGLKLNKIDLNDIYDSLSHKQDIIIYAAGDKNAIDTVKSKVGILPVEMETKFTKTALSSDTTAFSFIYLANEFVFRYEIRFDKEVISIKPLLAEDIKTVKQWVKNLRENK